MELPVTRGSRFDRCHRIAFHVKKQPSGKTPSFVLEKDEGAGSRDPPPAAALCLPLENGPSLWSGRRTMFIHWVHVSAREREYSSEPFED